MTTTTVITAIDRIPAPRDKYVVCKHCGAMFPRWQRKIAVDDAPRSGVKLLVAHELEAHGDGA